jgi:hypothetical protein
LTLVDFAANRTAPSGLGVANRRPYRGLKRFRFTVECKVGLAAVLARGAIIGAGVMQGIGAGEKIARIAGEPKREFKEFHGHMQPLPLIHFGAGN